jgi:hypothetical protein
MAKPSDGTAHAAAYIPIQTLNGHIFYKPGSSLPDILCR